MFPERRNLARSLLSDPPQVHRNAPHGVWRASADLYRFLIARTPVPARTLETGCGVSTAMFAAMRCDHVCVVADGTEADILREYLRDHDLPDVRFQIGTSDSVLPSLVTEPLDVFLIDGGHGWPTPIIDWFYGAKHLAVGGTVVIDDANLPAPANLVRRLDANPHWRRVAGTSQWAAFARADDAPLIEEWTEQSWMEDIDG